MEKGPVFLLPESGPVGECLFVVPFSSADRQQQAAEEEHERVRRISVQNSISK